MRGLLDLSGLIDCSLSLREGSLLLGVSRLGCVELRLLLGVIRALCGRYPTGQRPGRVHGDRLGLIDHLAGEDRELDWTDHGAERVEITDYH